MAEIIDGRAIAARIQEGVAARAAGLTARGVTPGIAVVLAGDDPASHTYVGMKIATAKRLGIHSEHYLLPESVSHGELMGVVRKLNADPAIHGILVQLPLPPQIDERAVLEGIDPQKDVDGFHPLNVGALVTGGKPLLPCTPAGIIEMLRATGVTMVGAEAVVVGRSNIVGKPVALLLLEEHATVTICHSRTRDLAAVCRRADILVAAVGKPRLITAEHVKPGAVVIDVGTNRVDGKLVGDVDFAAVSAVASAISPVPGGVGPMTIAMLLSNTVTAAERIVAGRAG